MLYIVYSHAYLEFICMANLSMFNIVQVNRWQFTWLKALKIISIYFWRGPDIARLDQVTHSKTGRTRDEISIYIKKQF